jgi:inosine-uridine nucleoside N-ribohydrolase
MKVTEPIPAIFDMDIGSDPDDTCVATMVLSEVARFRPVLLLTNDETPAFGRARFLSALVQAAPVDVPVAAGLPSQRRRQRCLVEDAGLCPSVGQFEDDAVGALIRVLEAYPCVRYFGLGALTNLDAALSLRPDLCDRIRLFQMGPALQGAYHRERPQYNARLDPGAFLRVVTRLRKPTFVMSHSTWGTYSTSSRQKLGVYPDDPLAAELRLGSPVAALFMRHLDAWVHTGMPCTILHDPLTVLAALEPGIVDVVDVELVVHDSGWTSLAADSHHALRCLLPGRAQVIASYLKAPPRDLNGAKIPCSLSLNTDDQKARRTIGMALLGRRGAEVAAAWGAHNSTREEAQA